MKKSKLKSERKSSKKDAKKDARKVARKELGSNLSAKFKEVIQSLGHEAEVIAKDIEKAGKFLSKKLSDKKIKKDAASTSIVKTLDSAIEQVKEKRTDTAQVENIEVKSPSTNTRRRVTTTKVSTSEEPEKKAVRPARKPAGASAKAATPASTRRGVQKNKESSAEKEVSAPESADQNEETQE